MRNNMLLVHLIRLFEHIPDLFHHFVAAFEKRGESCQLLSFGIKHILCVLKLKLLLAQFQESTSFSALSRSWRAS